MYKIKRHQRRIFYPHGVHFACRFLLIETVTFLVRSFIKEALDKISYLKAVVF